MKKLLRSVLVRSLCVLTLGILLVVYSGQVSRWLVMACGVLFILPGVLAVLSGIRSRGRRETSLIYPLVGIGSILFGTVQLIFPHLFFEALHYVLAIALLILPLVQLYGFWQMHRFGVSASWICILLPVVCVGIGVYVLFARQFDETDHLPLLLTGIGFIIYALLEMWSIILVRKSAGRTENQEIMLEQGKE